MKAERYFVSLFNNEQEVTKKQYIELERACGFNAPVGQIATVAFGKGPIAGRVVWGIWTDESADSAA
jgi:hypothetical protein